MFEVIPTSWEPRALARLYPPEDFSLQACAWPYTLASIRWDMRSGDIGSEYQIQKCGVSEGGTSLLLIRLRTENYQSSLKVFFCIRIDELM